MQCNVHHTLMAKKNQIIQWTHFLYSLSKTIKLTYFTNVRTPTPTVTVSTDQILLACELVTQKLAPFNFAAPRSHAMFVWYSIVEFQFVDNSSTSKASSGETMKYHRNTDTVVSLSTVGGWVCVFLMRTICVFYLKKVWLSVWVWES